MFKSAGSFLTFQTELNSSWIVFLLERATTEIIRMETLLLKDSEKGLPLVVQWLDFPWWSSGEDSALQCRGHWLHPWSRKIHIRGATTPRHLDYWTRSQGAWAPTPEPTGCNHESQSLGPVLHNQGGQGGEQPVRHNWEVAPLATTRESPRTMMKTQCSQK